MATLHSLMMKSKAAVLIFLMGKICGNERLLRDFNRWNLSPEETERCNQTLWLSLFMFHDLGQTVHTMPTLKQHCGNPVSTLVLEYFTYYRGQHGLLGWQQAPSPAGPSHCPTFLWDKGSQPRIQLILCISVVLEPWCVSKCSFMQRWDSDPGFRAC